VLSQSACKRTLYLLVSPLATSIAFEDLLQFFFNFVQINQRAADFFP
jgi:hypothetical protein